MTTPSVCDCIAGTMWTSLPRPKSLLALVCLMASILGGNADTVYAPTNLGAIHQLSSVEAGKAAPVSVRGVVTFTHIPWMFVFVQDDTGGLFCYSSRELLFPKPGTTVEIQGTTDRGEYLPVLQIASIREVGPGNFPVEKAASGAQLWQGNFDCRWVRIEGAVTSTLVSTSPIPSLQLELSVDGQPVQALIAGWPTHGAVPRRASRVALTGVATTMADFTKKITGIRILSPEPALLKPLEESSEFAKKLPKRTIPTILKDESFDKRPLMRTEGIVTLEDARELYVHDGNAGLRVMAPFGHDLKEGERVDMVVKPEAGTFDHSVELIHVLSHVSQGLPEPLHLPASDLSDWSHFGRLVEVDGEFLHRAPTSASALLVLKEGETTFEARIRTNATQAINRLAAGTVVRARGVLRLFRGPSETQTVARLQVASGDFIKAVSSPPWPLKQTLSVVLTLCAMVAVGLLGLAIAHQRLRRSNDRVAAAERELKELNLDLERRIELRTSQLKRLNQQLNNEILDRQQAEAAVADRESRLQDAQAIAHIGSFHWDAISNKVSWSRELFRIYGQSQEGFNATYEAYLSQIHPEDRARVEQAIGTTFQGAQSFTHDYRIVRPGGEVRWVAAVGRALRDNAGNLIGLEGTCQDVTEAKQSESLKQGQTEVLEMIAHGAPLHSTLEKLVLTLEKQSPELLCSILLLDEDGLHLRHGAAPSLPDDYNRKINGYAIGPCAGSCGTAAFRRQPVVVEDIEKDPLWENARSLALAAGLKACWSTPIFDGQDNVLGTFAVYYRQPGHPTEAHRRLLQVSTHTAAICIARDRAEKLQASLEVRLRHSQKMEAIGTLAGGIAHDFNNILGAIIGYAGLAQLDVDRPQEAREHLAHLQQAAQRARELIRLILTFGRREDLQKQVIDIAPLVQESVRMLRVAMPQNVEIQIRQRDPAPRILGDPTQIQQVIMNLANNAAQAIGQAQGTIIMDFGPARTHLKSLSDKGPVECLRLTVTDNGPGIPADIQDRIFEPFFTTKEPGKGTGLGLAVVHGIVDAHGGEITLQSEIGRGARFIVDLPALKYQLTAEGNPALSTPAASPRVEPAPPVLPPHTEEHRILLVDDEQSLLKIGQNLLSRAGFKVIPFNDPLSAFQAFQAAPESFDLVVTDHTMGGMSGVELAARINEIRPSTPVIICTGHGTGLAYEMEKHSGFRRILHKPVEFQELHTTVCLALGVSRNPVASSQA